jgi:hypothetical protein
VHHRASFHRRLRVTVVALEQNLSAALDAAMLRLSARGATETIGPAHCHQSLMALLFSSEKGAKRRFTHPLLELYLISRHANLQPEHNVPLLFTYLSG